MRKILPIALIALVFPHVAPLARAGIYSKPVRDSANANDAPVPGFIGPHGDGKARIDQGGAFQNPGNYVNPLFFAWANSYENYLPAPGNAASWANPDNALGRVTGDPFDVVSLGDLSAAQISNAVPVGRITLTFSQAISDLSGADFVVFENGFATGNLIFGELAYVEVSSDGVNFVRFPSISLNSNPITAFGNFDATNVFNLAGKHGNSYGESWGTPFDLSHLKNVPAVTGGLVNLQQIRYVRIVDIPGSGAFLDAAGRSIYDPWQTIGSGGFDLDAVGVISRRVGFLEWQTARGLTGNGSDDTDLDGLVDLLEYVAGRDPIRPDSTTPVSTTALVNGRLEFSFERDERAVDATAEVQVSEDLLLWTTIARSLAGGQLTGVNGFSPVITETGARTTFSVGVIRRVTVADVVDTASAKARFFRVKWSLTGGAF